MDWSAFWSGLAGGATGGGLLGVLIVVWLNHRLADDRAKMAEERAKVAARRDATIAVADVISEWVRPPGVGETGVERRWKIQSVYWKAVLVLDKKILDPLIERLAHTKGAPELHEIVVMSRQLLLGLDKPDLKAVDLNRWLTNADNAAISASTDAMKSMVGHNTPKP